MWTLVTGLTEDEVERVVLCLTESELESAQVLHRDDRFALYFAVASRIVVRSAGEDAGQHVAEPPQVRLPV
jgi:hypothetical protein